MNRPMSTGRHVWSIKTEINVGSYDHLGVCELINSFDHDFYAPQNFKFYAYRYAYAQKWNHEGHQWSYGKPCKLGDVITTILEFKNGTGVLSFEVNGKDQGVAFRGLEGPLYPMAWMFSGNKRLTIIH